MRVGVIGCGGMGRTHYLALKELSGSMDIEVTALSDCREEYLNNAAQEWPRAVLYETGMELISKAELDAVHICLPSYLHAGHAAAAMKKGMHVFVEKPVCLTEEDCEMLQKTERETGALVMVGQVVRYFDEYKKLKEIYESGKYGRLKSLMMRRLSGDVIWGYENWFHDEEKSGSVVMDLHVHDVDFLRYLLGEPDDFSVKATAFEDGMVNHIVAQYRFGTAFAQAEAIWDESVAFPFQAEYRAYFEKGTVMGRDGEVTVYEKGEAGKKGRAVKVELTPEFTAEDDSAGINISMQGPYFSEIKDFYTCIKEKRPIETAPLKEAVKSALLAREEWKAAKQYISGQ